LKAYNININFSILDVGCYSDDNIKELYQSKIPFITRLIPNRKIFKEFQANDITDLMTPKNAVLYENRLLYVKIKKFMVCGYVSYAYLILDADRHLKEFKDFLKLKDFDFDMSSEDASLQYKKFGFFIIVSSEYLIKEDIIPLYYARQGIEQIFDVCKNKTDLLPISCHNIETFRGYLLS
jgi:transposase